MRPGFAWEVAAGTDRPASEAEPGAPPAVTLAVAAPSPSPTVAVKRTLGTRAWQ